MRALGADRRRFFRFLAVLVCGVLLSTALATARVASAQPVSGNEKTQLEARKEALFQEMLRNPGNLDVTFAYADVAARLGDYEAAVSALDRMLLFNPNLPRVQLEIGALYFRMGSYDLAHDYFARAAAANPPPAVRERIDEYMALIDKASSRNHFSGYAFFGAQHQSDANVAPGSPLILSPIGPVLLNSQFSKQASGSIFGSGSILYSYDLEDQRRDSVDVTAVGYANHYFNTNVNHLDLDLFELTAGPRINFPSGGLLGNIAASVKPYIIGDEVGLGGSQYFGAIGTGLEYDETVWNDVLLKSVFEFRNKSFTNVSSRPLSTGLDGNDKLLSVSLNKPVAANALLNLEFDYLDQTTKFSYYANSTYAVIAAYRMNYDAPFKLTAFPWETSLFLGRAWSIYRSPDPCCVTGTHFDPETGTTVESFSSQLTQRWRFGLTEAVAVTPRVSMVLQLERDIVSSNLPIYAYTSSSILLGPQIRF
jgi:tetratricopeptide (TPR) repeat protein